MKRVLHRYRVYCGNIGMVHSGHNKREAVATFTAYKKASKLNFGRGSGEDVTLMQDLDPLKEYYGTRGNE
jgi:hypothetical protein